MIPRLPRRSLATALLLLGGSLQAQSLVLNEVYARHAGIDRREFIEIQGNPGESLAGVVLLTVDGAEGFEGTLDKAVDMSGHVVPADGFFVAGMEYAAEVDLLIPHPNWLRNRTHTLYLVRSNDVPALLARVGTNVDVDGDGITDIRALATVLDHVALVHGDYLAGLDRIYDGAESRGPEGGEVPSGIFRSQVGTWCTDYLDHVDEVNLDQPQTPGAPNGPCSFERRRYVPWTEPGVRLADYGTSVVATGVGSMVLVGVPGDDVVLYSGRSGSVHVIDGITGEKVRFLAPAQGMKWDVFGTDVDSSGSVALVGAPGEDGPLGTNTGAAYLFDWTTGQELARLMPAALPGDAEFGWAVAVEGDYGVVGAPSGYGAGSFGAAYVYHLPTASLLHTLVPADIAGGDRFGQSVALSGTQVLIGSPMDDDFGQACGSAYVFDVVTGGEVAKVLSPTPGEGHRFGTSVAMDEFTILVGAPHEQAGIAHAFERSSGAYITRLRAPAGSPPAGFGKSLALQGRRVLAGSAGFLSDRVLLFELDDPLVPIVIEAAGPGGELFGTSVAFQDQTLLIGATEKLSQGDDTGVVVAVEMGVGASYCQATPNSTGAAADLSAQGTSSLAAQDLWLEATPVPALQPGLFFYGPAPASVPFGNGLRCVGGMLARLPIEVSSATGELRHGLDTTAPPSLASAITPGSTWYFQAWFRDPALGGSFDQLSDGLEVLFRQ